MAKVTDGDVIRYSSKYHMDKMEARIILESTKAYDGKPLDPATLATILCKVYDVKGIKGDVLQSAHAQTVKNGLLDVESLGEWYQLNMFTDVGSTESTDVRNSSKETKDFASAYGVDMQDLEKIRTKFNKYDENKSGALDKNEFQLAMKDLFGASHADIGETRLDRFFREVDTDGSGVIEFPEFLIWYIGNFSGEANGQDAMKHLYSSGSNPLGDIVRSDSKAQQAKALARALGSKERAP